MQESADDRDYYGNKRLELAGQVRDVWKPLAFFFVALAHMSSKRVSSSSVSMCTLVCVFSR